MMRNHPRKIFFWLVLIILAALGTGFFAASDAAADSPLVHVVGWGDTMFSIAARYGTSVNAIMQTNGLRNPNFIFVGQRLVIPGGGAPAPLPSSTYVVQAGDTLFSIATRHGTTVSALMQANGLYNYWIYVGQTLRIPGQAAPPVVPLPIPQPPPQPHGAYHIVRPGDYLALLAYRYGSSVYAIQIANHLANPSFIWVGQRLFIPGGVAPINPPAYKPLPPIYPPQQVINVPPLYPPGVVSPGVPIVPPTPLSPPVVIVQPPVVPHPDVSGWEAILISNTIGTGPCSVAVTVVGKSDWPVVVATTDGSWISDPKFTGTKPERGPYVVEFAHACTGIWRVIPLGLNIYADVEISGGHAELEFRPRS